MSGPPSGAGLLPAEIPIRPNSFFTHLNHDIRYMVYNLIDLPPVSLSSLGLVLSCREALAESEQVAKVHLNRHLLAFKSAAKAEGHVVVLPQLPDQPKFCDMSRIKITSREELLFYPSTSFMSLLSYCFSEVTFICKTPEELGALVSAEEIAAVQVRFNEASLEHSWYEYSRSSGHCKRIVDTFSSITEAVDKHYRYWSQVSNMVTPPIPVRTKTIAVVWGDMPPDIMAVSVGFEYFEATYPNRIKDEMHRMRVISKHYAWPTWKQATRDDESAGMVALSSGSRWVNGVDRWALNRGRLAQTTDLLFRRTWRNAPID
jgi:hypothetical protein